MRCQNCTRKRKQKLYPFNGKLVCGKCFMQLSKEAGGDN